MGLLLLSLKDPFVPTHSRFWEVIQKHRSISSIRHHGNRSLAKEKIEYVRDYRLDSLKVIGSVGELSTKRHGTV
jgi:acetyl-CoA synthetase